MLTPESCSAIDREIAKYPSDRFQSAIMAALRIAQEEKGSLSKELIGYVARYLSIPEILAYEVATFYNMYDLKPVGQHKLVICTNLPCALRGACEASRFLKKRLRIEFGETTLDGNFTLEEGECFGACSEAPILLHNNRELLTQMSPERLEDFLGEALNES